MANISTENINTLAQLAASIADGDYIYIYKASSNTFARIEKSVLLEGMETDISNIISNDWNDSSKDHVPSARKMNLMYNNLISVYNSLAATVGALANSAFKTAKPSIVELDWVGNSASFSIGYNLTHCSKTQASPTSVAEDDSFTATIVPDAGYTLNGVEALGSGFSQTYDEVNDQINISASNVNNGMTITCVGVTFQVNVNYNLTGFSSETNTTMQSGGSFTKVLSPNTGYIVKTITITMGGVTLNNSQVWNLSTNTITIPVITGDIVITATAEETTNHIITYDLSGCIKSSGPNEMEDGGALTAVLSKGDDFNGIYNTPSSGSGKNRNFSGRDVIVMMDGDIVEDAVSQTNLDGDVTISIGEVTGDVVITNIQWVVGIINYSTGVQSSSERSVCNANDPITLPDGCEELQINHTYPGSGTYGVAFFGESGYISGNALSSGTNPLNVEVPSGATYIKLSFYDFTNTYSMNNAYIKDVTNDNYIWKGDNVE